MAEPSSTVAPPGIRLETRHCPLCGPEASKRVRYPASFNEEDLNAAVFSARRLPDRRHFRLVECLDCGIIFSDPACDAQTLSRLYRDSAVSYTQREEAIFASYAPILDRALRRLARRGVFLEIGGGSGFMLEYGARRGFEEQIEIEPSADAEGRFKSPGNARFIRGVFSRGLLPPNSASLICFFQMLDHVPDPLGLLAEVHEVLEPGGVAVSITHNTAALSARLLGELSPIFDIEHTFLFNPANLSRLFKRAGFAQFEVFPVSNRYPLSYWMHLAPLPGRLKRASSWMIEQLRIGDLKLAFRAGNFAVIAQKAKVRS